MAGLCLLLLVTFCAKSCEYVWKLNKNAGLSCVDFIIHPPFTLLPRPIYMSFILLTIVSHIQCQTKSLSPYIINLINSNIMIESTCPSSYWQVQPGSCNPPQCSLSRGKTSPQPPSPGHRDNSQRSSNWHHYWQESWYTYQLGHTWPWSSPGSSSALLWWW